MPSLPSEPLPQILIAAGNAELRAAIAAVFGTEHYRLVVAGDGKDALNKAHGQAFDLVVSGIEMSEFDGIELLAKLAKTKPRLPVFIVAEGKNEIDKTYLRYATLLGARATFRHPLDPAAFLAKVGVALQERNRNGAPQEA
jgi:CheY-like chemotaxis protein